MGRPSQSRMREHDWAGELSREQEERLQAALLCGLEQELAVAPKAELTPAARRRFAEMLADPAGYAAENGRRTGRAKRLGRWRSCAVAATLLLALGLGTFVLSPPARAGIMQIFSQQGMSVQTYAAYDKLVFSQPQTDAVLPELTVGYLPEGWRQAAEKPAVDGRSLRLVYEPAAGEAQLEVWAAVAEEGLDVCLQNTQVKISEAEINGCRARIYAAEAAEQPSCITWLAANDRVLVTVSGRLTLPELVAVAEGIEIADEQ